MRTIWKFELDHMPDSTLIMPEGSHILSFMEQFNHLFIWAMVNPETQEKVERTFVVYGTGHPITEDTTKLHHIGTIKYMEGALIWHLFEREP